VQNHTCKSMARVLGLIGLALLASLASCASAPAAPPASPVTPSIYQDVSGPPPGYSRRGLPPTRLAADVHLGLRNVSAESFDDLDRQLVPGFTINNHDPEADRLFGYEFSGFVGQTSDNLGNERLEGSMTELAFGLRHNMRPMGGFVPFAGVGFSILLAERERWGQNSFDSNTDLGAGVYVHGGFYYMLSHSYRIGVDLRATPWTTDMELIDGDEESLESYQATVFLGFSL